MNKPIVIISKFYKKIYTTNKIRGFLFYNNFNFLKFYTDSYTGFNNKIKIFNYFNFKFVFINI